MQNAIDVSSLYALLSAACASGFEIANRIKSIAQVAHERLGTSSIVAYAFSRVTEELEIVAMPGVAKPELMRGPADKLFFLWNRPEKGEPDEIWVETKREYARQMGLYRQRPEASTGRMTEADFRERERDKHRSRGDPDGSLAVGKVCLWKGTGQTNDPVGQVFFNFWRTKGSRRIFTPEMRDILKLVAGLIRELLIERIYHQDLPSIELAPERLLRDINRACDHCGDADFQGLERKLAEIVCNAALTLTKNYSGRAEFWLLIGRRIARAFSGGRNSPPRPLLLRGLEITETCIRKKSYFVGNAIEEGVYSDFQGDVCRSAMVVPVVHEGEVRAVIRLTSPAEGCFLDTHARAMQTLEHFARYGILRLDERRQRSQMQTALQFYTESRDLAQTGQPADLMKAVLEALEADWGTFWPAESYPEQDIRSGILFEAAGGKAKPSIREVSPGDPQYGIRPETGFTGALLKCNDRCPKTCFALHPMEGDRDQFDGEPRQYDVQVFPKSDGGRPRGAPALEEDGSCPGCGLLLRDKEGRLRIPLSPNTSEGAHTRVAFVVHDGRTQGVVWLKFGHLREMPWWERRYLEGLSGSLGKFLRVGGLHLVVRGFNHMIPDFSHTAKDIIDYLKRDDRLPASDPTGRAIRHLESYATTIHCKTAEVRSLLPIAAADEQERDPDSFYIQGPVGHYVKMAIDVATTLAEDVRPWRCEYGSQRLPREQISSVFYSALLNLTMNVVRHGWEGLKKGQERAVIWIRRRMGMWYTCVGNNGKELEADPMWQILEVDREHKIGLQVVRELLRLKGGAIRWLSVGQFRQEYPTAPDSTNECVTFFEFTVPAL